jgi:hypothetical protein
MSEFDLMQEFPDEPAQEPAPQAPQEPAAPIPQEPTQEPPTQEPLAFLRERLAAQGFTRKYQLYYWAELIRRCPFQLKMLRNLEYMGDYQLRAEAGGPDTIFGIAAANPAFQAAGVTDDSAYTGKQHFQLTQNELHYISCDCLGQLTNDQMASRIGEIAYAIRD